MFIYANTNDDNKEEFIEIGGVKIPKTLKHQDGKTSEGNIYGHIVVYKIMDDLMLTFNSKEFEITFSIDNKKHKNEFVFYIKPDVKQIGTREIRAMIYILQTNRFPDFLTKILDSRSRIVGRINEPCFVIYEDKEQVEYIYFPELECEVFIIHIQTAVLS